MDPYEEVHEDHDVDALVAAPHQHPHIPHKQYRLRLAFSRSWSANLYLFNCEDRNVFCCCKIIENPMKNRNKVKRL